MFRESLFTLPLYTPAGFEVLDGAKFVDYTFKPKTQMRTEMRGEKTTSIHKIGASLVFFQLSPIQRHKHAVR